MKKEQKQLTNPQKSIWLIEKFFENTSVSNVGGSLLIHEKVNFDLFEKAINLFIQKNDGIRLCFTMQGGTPTQYVKEPIYQKFDIVDINSEEDLQQKEKEFIQIPFSLFDSFLFTFRILKLKDGSGGFYITTHHLISDAWSMSLLVDEIIDIYSSLLKNEFISDANYPSYFEYIETEKKYFLSDKFKKDETYWNGLFSSCPSCVSFSQKNPKNSSPIAKRKAFFLENSNSIFAFCKQYDISPFTFLMAVYAIYLYRITGNEEVILGSPILNRNGVKEKAIFGLFINTLPIKIELKDGLVFTDLIKNISQNQFSMFRHHKYPYPKLLETLREKYQFSNSLYDTIISYQNARNNSQSSDIPYSTNWDFNGYCSNSLDIHIYDLDNNGVLQLYYDYRLDKFEESEIEDIHSRIIYIIEQILNNPNLAVHELEIVSPAEKQLLVHDLNNTFSIYEKDKTIVELFEKQVTLTPNKIAVAFGNQNLTYKELNEKANQLANFLRAFATILPNQCIGILTKRSIQMAIGLLAILKSGAAYVPIDPEYPSDRISYMLEDSGANYILVDDSTKDLCIDKNTINLDHLEDIFINEDASNLSVVNNPSDLMYLIYTSGSTGKPKGVMLTHQNVNNYLHGLTNVIDFSSDKVMVSVTTICFDIFVTEFWGSLLNGLTVVLANEQEQNISSDLNKLCQKYHVNMIQTTPSRFSLWLQTDELDFLNEISDLMVGGEALPRNLLQKLKEYTHLHIYNMYGPTETAVWSTIKSAPKEDLITIGTPIANTQVYILDSYGHLLPPGIAGNLYIGGDGVCKGYRNRPELNKEVFIPSPFNKDEILYNTKDLAYRLKNGELVHLGRTDFQAKIHGFRVELGEIENAIIEYPDVKNAVVLLQNGSLNAFIVSDVAIEIENLIDYLLKHLPHYMIPKNIVQVSDFPLTPNGKINRKHPIFTVQVPKISHQVLPTNDIEKILYDVFNENLHLDIGITDNFFEYGVDSLMIINLVSQLYLYDIHLTIQDFYNHTTIESLAKKIINNNSIFGEETDTLKEKHITDISSVKSKLDKTILPKKDANILLTGVTGFLGIHILKDLIENTNYNIYCIIRKKDGKDIKTRLIERLSYYFDGAYENLIDKRIFVIDSDITLPYFGLSKEEYEILGNKISYVIHCAADVRHFGDYALSEKINIQSTNTIIHFCLDFNIILNHISTMTVSGYGLVNVPEHLLFDENSFYIHQKYQDNIYVKTKFMAEEAIYRALSVGLIAKIYRIGNLTNRFLDGKFQFNSYENAFLNKLRTIKNLKILPDTLKDTLLELTPVDSCASAIVKLMSSKIENNIQVFHLYNPNYVPISSLTDILEKLGVCVDYMKSEEFQDVVMTKSHTAQELSGFLEQLQTSELVKSYDDIFSSSSTLKTLSNLDFTWPKISEEYLDYLLRSI